MRPLWSAAFFAISSRAFRSPPPLRSHCRHLASPRFMSLSKTMSSSNESLDRAKKRISQAISIGAPAYNAGDIERCATVYSDTAREIAPLLPAALQSKLMREVNDTSDATNYDAKAWALRRVFDSIIEYQMPIIPGIADDSISYEPFSSSQLGGEPVGVMDSVMGGISRGSWMAKSNTFFGETSLANNGGFASLRWRFPVTQNWSYAKGIYIKGLRHSKAEEHTFRIILKDDACERVRLANYKAVFANPERADQPLLIPFAAFNKMEQMGRVLNGSPAFNPTHVTEIGLMAIKPTVVGEFQLEFAEWGLYV